MFRSIKRLYNWVLSWAHTPYGKPALFFLAVCESIFFPVPPDVLLMALSVSRPKKAFRYAAICSVGSVLGGVIGYLVGLYFMEAVGYRIIELYGFTGKYDEIGALYRHYDAWAVGIAGFTPIPYKIFTISAGAFKIDFLVFFTASIISRSARFFLIGFLFYKYGETMQVFIDRYFNILTILFTAFLILGFVALGAVLR